MSAKSVLQGKGYNPAVGPQSTDPNSEIERVRNSNNSSVINHNTSPIQSPGTIKKQINVTNMIYEKNLYRSKNEINLSSISYLFMQIIQYNLKTTKSLLKLERNLNNLGYTIGLKYLELTSLRQNFTNNISSSGKSNVAKRHTRLLEVLQYITQVIWPSLFEKPVDSLEKSSDKENQYMIIDNKPVMTKYISVPKDFESLNCEAFTAGIIEGILDVCYFRCEVSAHTAPQPNHPERTVYLIKFDDAVVMRETRLK